MTKKDAIRIFGKYQVDLANALGKSKSAINQWADDLTVDQIRMVIGEAYIQGKEIPESIKHNLSKSKLTNQ